VRIAWKRLLVALQPAFRRFMDEVLAVFAAEADGMPNAGEGGRGMVSAMCPCACSRCCCWLASLRRDSVLPKGVIKRRDVAAICGDIGQCRQLGKGFAVGFAQGGGA